MFKSEGFKSLGVSERGGPYDAANEELRQKFDAEACLLIVLSGSHGTGVSISAPEDLKPHLPALFRAIAQEVENALATEHHAMLCPVCSAPLAFDPRHGITARTVPDGSITVCAVCTSFLTLEEKWRVMGEDELVELNDDVRNALNRTRREIQRRRSQDNN